MGNYNCKKCGVPHNNKHSIQNTCRIHRFYNNICRDCGIIVNSNNNLCKHNWSTCFL